MSHLFRRRYLAAGVSAVLVTCATLIGASLGGASASDPGGTLSVGPATVVDNNTGFTYTFTLRADEDATTGGVGSVFLGLGGDAVSLCTVHGPGAFVDPTTEAGINPYPEIQCGRAFGQPVSVDGCVATSRAHGFMHSDWPNIPFLDGVTIDIRFQKMDATTGQLDVTVPIPAGKVEIHGKVTGAIVMSTCP